MKTLTIIIVVTLIVIFLIRYRLDKLADHNLFLKLNPPNTIHVYDKDGLIAIISYNKRVYWERTTSMYKILKIENICNNFEEEYLKLI